jgi:predicted metalloprotease with PDZ domain
MATSPDQSPGLVFRIDVGRPAAREIGVELDFHPEPSGGFVDLFLPTWTPGSYLVREFSRHLGRVEAIDHATGRLLLCAKTTKNRFRVHLASGSQRVLVRYRVYAHELSVRTADLTDQHAYWNHACVLLCPVGGSKSPVRIEVTHPAGWNLACALDQCTGLGGHGGAATTTVLLAADMEEAYDAPCLVARLHRVEWSIRGVPFLAAIDGLAPVSLPETFQRDLTAIVERAADLFGGDLPFPRYTLLCLFSNDGFGGLEHGSSTTLLHGRTAFATAKGYREFLALAAHEIFHAWNGKRLRPAEFWSYDYEQENYTEFLWLIEGWTAYYDDLLCLRAGVFSRADYFAAVAKNINGMLGAPGRMRLSLRESSHDAWIRLYRPDENTRNSSQNYYGNGAVAAMCLDLVIRRESGGQRSLDDVVRRLFEESKTLGRGYTRDDVERVLRAVGGGAVVQVLADLVDDRLDPPLCGLLAAVGVKLVERDADRPWFGVQFEAGSTVVASVTGASPAHDAGVHPGDELLGLDRMRVDPARWQDVFAAVARVGAKLDVLYSRRGVIDNLEVVPRSSPGTVVLEIDESALPAAREQMERWLASANQRTGAPK